MKNLLVRFGVLACLGASALPAQTVESIPYRAILSPRNENPPIEINASGTATVWLHVVRDSSGQVVSGSVDFSIRYTFPEAITFTGLHIHRGAAGVNGPVVINSSLTSAPSPATGTLFYQGQVLPTNDAALSAMRDILTNPAGFYVNLHTSVNPGGVIRGQLMPAEMRVYATQLLTSNENPPITGLEASGVGALTVLTTKEPDGNYNSAEATFDVNYTGFPSGTAFTGLHIHSGAAGVNGPVTVNSSLSGQVPAAASGAGSLSFSAEVPLTANALGTLYGMVTNPAGYYMNLHTVVNAGGVIRGQVRATDRMSFQVNLLPSNEVPPIAGLTANAYSAYTLHTIRNDSGSVVGALSIYDVNFRFPGETQFTGMHIHDGAAGANGPVTIDSGANRNNVPISPDGFGNIYRAVVQSSATALNSINGLTQLPQNYYLNLHTLVNAGGAVRSQLAQPNTAGPVISAVLSGVSDPTKTTVAPLGLMTVFGSNLMNVASSGDGRSNYASQFLNGVGVTVGGKQAAIVSLGRDPRFSPTDYIVVEVPSDIAQGVMPVVVGTPTGTSSPVDTTVSNLAPAIYFDAAGAIAFRAADGSLVRPDNPALAGEVVGVICTGLGTPTPSLLTGEAAPSSGYAVRRPTAKIANRDALIVLAEMVPGFVGLSYVAVQVPTGVAGTVPVVISYGDINSNAANLIVK